MNQQDMRPLLIVALMLSLNLLFSPVGGKVFCNVQGRPETVTRSRAYKFINGQWFDGKAFRRRTFYCADGRLSLRPPNKIDEVIDLGGGYVVPPFGDAHCHGFSNPYDVSQQVEMYLRDGIFYAKVMTNPRKGALKVAERVNKPTSVDVSYAHGGLTGNYSHPIGIYEALALGFYTPESQRANVEKIRDSRLRENDAYYLIDNAADLETKWPMILRGKPDFIKVFLLHSEGYEARKKQTGFGIGIDPQLLPAIVTRSHAAGLRVSAHVDSAADYHAALKAGIDEMAHLPGSYIGPNEDVRAYRLSSDDVRDTARRGVRVTPTASLADNVQPPPIKERTKANQIYNLKLLKKAGVKFSIGSDTYGADALKEALYLNKLGVFTNLELLKMWSEDTPRSIFPTRKIGFFKESFEGSFVVLTGNPLEDFDQVKNIRLRFKQGYFIGTETPQH